ncbi:MAG: methionine--tRNA ligase [Bacteroidales bacterium]|nr:methionine--tRNA ligase [Bacteroidales bacterium]
MKEYKRYTLTAALPYANGPIHFGHLAGVYIPADIFARYLRGKSLDIIFVCGSDEHGVPITIKAKNEGVSPQDVVDKYHSLNKESFERLGISFDIYSRTTSPVHYETATEFFKTLYNKGEFIEKTTEQYYDPEAEQFLADRYITGTCPRCGNENAYGDQCENCGSSLNATDLINPQSMISGAVPVLKETNHWFLPLDKYEAFLKKWILEDNKHWKPNVYGQCKSWLDGGLQPRAVSRDLDWGIPVPVKGAEGKVLYVWFDAPIGYISATRELTPDWEKYWKSEDTRLIHFIGKDNIVFHCIVFPAMLNAEGSYILPENVPANEFLNLEGDKLSTSRNWAVWLHEYLDEFPGKQDVLRYVLCANAPETKDNDFTWKDFQARNNNELLAIFGNFVNRTMVLTHKYFGGKVPAQAELSDFDHEVLEQFEKSKQAIEKSLDTFRFREALKEAMDLARLGNKYLADTEPWKIFKTDPERVRTILNISLQLTANLSILFDPFLPDTSSRLRKMIDLKNFSWADGGRKDLLEVNHLLNQPELLFERIEDEVIEAQLQKLKNNKLDNENKALVSEPSKSAVSFDDFGKMDIRVATILSAEKVAKTKKLMKLLVDTGIDKRTVVSGIAEFFEPENLVGQKVCILLNLEPREIKGIQSQGMILLSENADGKLFFVEPRPEAVNGSMVK